MYFVDPKETKICKVFIVPNSNGKSDILQDPFGNLTYKSEDLDGEQRPVDLYIVSNDKIRDGDYFMSFHETFGGTFDVYVADQKWLKILDDNAQTADVAKIIASMNKNHSASFISEEFIQEYVKTFDRRNPIKEVEIEMDYTRSVISMSPTGLNHHPLFEVKTDKDNCVIVVNKYKKDTRQKQTVYSVEQREDGNALVSNCFMSSSIENIVAWIKRNEDWDDAYSWYWAVLICELDCEEGAALYKIYDRFGKELDQQPLKKK